MNYTFKQVFDKYVALMESDNIETKTQRSRFKRLSTFHNMKINEITASHVLDWKIEISHSGLAHGTIREIHQLGITLFNFAHNYDMFEDYNPFKKVAKAKTSPKKLRVFSEGQLCELENHFFMSLHAYPELIMIAYGTGMRKSELARLNKDSYIAKNKFRVRTKNKNEITYRTVFIPKHLQDICAKNIMWKEEPHFKDINILVNKINKTINELGFNDSARSAHERLTFHSFRHYFCTKLVESNTPLPVIQQLTGHSSLLALERYIHVKQETAETALNNMWDNIKL